MFDSLKNVAIHVITVPIRNYKIIKTMISFGMITESEICTIYYKNLLQTIVVTENAGTVPQ